MMRKNFLDSPWGMPIIFAIALTLIIVPIICTDKNGPSREELLHQEFKQQISDLQDRVHGLEDDMMGQKFRMEFTRQILIKHGMIQVKP